MLGRGDDTVGNPHRAQISQLELFELSFRLLELDKHKSIERFEATVSQSTVPSPLYITYTYIYIYIHTYIHYTIICLRIVCYNML